MPLSVYCLCLSLMKRMRLNSTRPKLPFNVEKMPKNRRCARTPCGVPSFTTVATTVRKFRSAAFFFAVFLSATQARAIIDRVVEKKFAVPAGSTASLDVDTFYGPIKLTTTNDPTIHVVVREAIEAKDDAEADRQLRDLDLQVSQAPSAGVEKVTVRAAYRRTVHWSWEKWPPLGLAFEIEIPARCQLRLVSHEGAITVPALRGDIEVLAQNGEVFVGAIEGAVNVKAGVGNVTVTSCAGPLTIDARSGNVLVGRLQNSATIDEVGGTVEIQSSHGPLHVRGDGSDVHVGFVYPIRGDADVRASGGDVDASFESTVRANLDARASTFGQVRIRELDLNLTTGAAGDAHVAGTLGGGGPLLQIRASGGNVKLRGVPAVKE